MREWKYTSTGEQGIRSDTEADKQRILFSSVKLIRNQKSRRVWQECSQQIEEINSNGEFVLLNWGSPLLKPENKLLWVLKGSDFDPFHILPLDIGWPKL